MDLDFHHAKNIIETNIGQYLILTKNESGVLPKIELKGDKTEVSFSLSDDVDLYAIVSRCAGILEGDQYPRTEVKISSSYRDSVSLQTKNARISLSLSYTERNFHFYKEGCFESKDIESIIQAYKLSHPAITKADVREELKELGVTLYDGSHKIGWDAIAGYETVKNEVRDTIILSLQHPEVFDTISKQTRVVYESSRPKAVLFEGPPGTGKTTMARVIASEVNVPLLYVPIESIMSKWYGESERNLARIFSCAEELGSTLLFFDEIDSLAQSREKGIHEASRRVLSVLLRQLDGFQAKEATMVIGATNRKDDLDSALLNRFDVSLEFALPVTEERAAIFKLYAQQLSEEDVKLLGEKTNCYSGRSIKDVCEYAERRCASKMIREGKVMLPELEDYIKAVEQRKR